MKLPTLIAACLLAASTVTFAQSTPPDAGKGHQKMQFDCSKAKDPKRCEERQASAKAARKACESKKGAEHEACMRTEFCAKSPDPKQCEARAKEKQARGDKVREACKDKKGDEYRACVREQRGGKK